MLRAKCTKGKPARRTRVCKVMLRIIRMVMVASLVFEWLLETTWATQAQSCLHMAYSSRSLPVSKVRDLPLRRSDVAKWCTQLLMTFSGMPRPGPVSSIPRGPPRKPKQSGHALWVGNLPPGTTIVALKDHFSRDATKDIESLFLISKSNCAFVNYRTEASCTAAMHRFHD